MKLEVYALVALSQLKSAKRSGKKFLQQGNFLFLIHHLHKFTKISTKLHNRNSIGHLALVKAISKAQTASDCFLEPLILLYMTELKQYLQEFPFYTTTPTYLIEQVRPQQENFLFLILEVIKIVCA